MIYFDAGYAAKVAICGVLSVVAFVVATAQLLKFAAYCDSEERALKRDREHRGFVPDEPRKPRALDPSSQRNDTDYHDIVPALRPERVIRHSTEMAALEGLDELEQWIG